MAGFGRAGSSRRGYTGQGRVRSGKAGQAAPGQARQVMVWYGRNGEVWQGGFRHGQVRQARCVTVGSVEAGPGEAG